MPLNQSLVFACCITLHAAALAATESKIDVTTPSKNAALVNTSICDLAKQRGTANGMHVRVKALFSTDLLERSFITDPQCPEVVVAPFDAAKPELDTKSMKRFDRAVRGRLSDSSARVFSFNISGKYIWRMDETKSGAIYIEKVWSFKRIHDSGK